MIFRCLPGAHDSVLVMQMLMPRLRMHDVFFCGVGVKLNNVRFAVVDPHDVIVTHGVRGLSDRRASSVRRGSM